MQHPAKVYNRNVARVRISLSPQHSLVAQLVELPPFKRKVTSSNLVGGTEKENVL